MGKRTAVYAPIEVILEAAKYVGDLGQPEYCNVPNCGRTPKCMSLCKAHYWHYSRYRTKQGLGKTRPDWESIVPYVQPVIGTHHLTPRQRRCHVPGCKITKYEGRGLCYTHYKRWKAGLRNDSRSL